MRRFLFVVPPLAGHTLPTVHIGQELVARGHDVAWTGYAEAVGSLLPAGARLFALDGAADRESVEAAKARSRGLRGAAAFEFLWQDFLLPLARSMAPGVSAAVDAYRPDVVVVDQQALAGAVVARQRGLPWATSATTSAELVDPFTLLPKLGEWARRCQYELQLELGVSDVDARRGDLRFSEHLVLAFTTEALVGPLDRFPDHYAFVGPSIGVRRVPVDFPWSDLDPDRPLVLASLGTVNRDVGGRFLTAVVEAAEPLEVQLVLVAEPADLAAPPPHVLVRRFVPQLDLLPRTSVVVSHAGHNTVCESLAHGVPLLLAPIRDDQPIVAEQVVAAGAGIRVRFGRVGAAELREALRTLLTDPTYRTAAARVQASFAAAGGAAAGADRLEKLA